MNLPSLYTFVAVGEAATEDYSSDQLYRSALKWEAELKATVQKRKVQLYSNDKTNMFLRQYVCSADVAQLWALKRLPCEVQ